jgi:hypothetical protein
MGLIVVPGYVLSRLLLPAPRTWNGMLGQTFGAGVILTIPEWLLAASTGHAWPAVVLAVVVVLWGVVSRGHRERLRFEPQERVSPIPTAVMLAAVALQGVNFANNLFGTKLLPDTSRWYQDNLWHMSIAGVLTHKVVPDYPQALGDPLNYHWLSNAHMAVMHMVTGISLDVVLMRLWYWPMLIGAALIACALLETLIRRAWLAPLAGAAIMLMPTLRASGWMGLPATHIWVPFSPSQTLALPVLLFAVFLCLAVLKNDAGRRMGLGLWIMTAAAFLVAPGAKSSNMPMVAAGLALALLAALIGRHGRRLQVRLAGLLALAVAATVATAPLFAGAGEGTKVRLFAALTSVRQWIDYSKTLGGSSPSWITPGANQPMGLLIMALIIFAVLMAFAWALPGLAALLQKRDEVPSITRVALWFMLGIGIAGFCALMLVDHDGYSQFYFMRGASAVLACFAVLGFDVALSRSAATPRVWAVAAAGTALGVVGAFGLYAARMADPKSTPSHEMFASVKTQTAWFMLVLLLAILTVWLWRRRTTAGRVLLLVVSTASIVAASGSMVPDLVTPGRLTYSEGMTPPQQGVTAALWIRDNTPKDAVVATNVHCYGLKTSQHCDTRTFWVSAFSERQTYIEGWGYSAEAHKMHGVGGRIYTKQPFHDQARFEENERAFATADPAALAGLKARGVSYLMGVTAASPVSQELQNRTDVVYRGQGVTVYRLR